MMVGPRPSLALHYKLLNAVMQSVDQINLANSFLKLCSAPLSFFGSTDVGVTVNRYVRSFQLIIPGIIVLIDIPM